MQSIAATQRALRLMEQQAAAAQIRQLLPDQPVTAASLAQTTQMLPSLATGVAKQAQQTREAVTAVITAHRERLHRQLTSNWGDFRPTGLFTAVKTITGDSIPVMWVPGESVLRDLVNAPDRVSRYAVLEQRHGAIVVDCRSALASLEDTAALGTYRHFTERCAAALEDGHWEAAQSLAASLLDTLMKRTELSKRIRDVIGAERQNDERALDFDRYKFWVAATIAPLVQSFLSYFVEKNDPTPTWFSRHGSAHSVGHEQYTAANAVAGLMQVTSLLKLHDTARPRERPEKA